MQQDNIARINILALGQERDIGIDHKYIYFSRNDNKVDFINKFNYMKNCWNLLLGEEAAIIPTQYEMLLRRLGKIDEPLIYTDCNICNNNTFIYTQFADGNKVLNIPSLYRPAEIQPIPQDIEHLLMWANIKRYKHNFALYYYPEPVFKLNIRPLHKNVIDKEIGIINAVQYFIPS